MRLLTHSRLFQSLLLLSMSCLVCKGQSTTVSATVVDQGGVTWANGTWKLEFKPNPNYNINSVMWNGSPFPSSQWVYAGSMDASGALSHSIPSNNFITPVGSTYTVTVCPNATAPCSVIQNVTIQGTSLNLSSTITSNTTALVVRPLPFATAYTDAEVAINPSLVGYFYMNVSGSTPQPRYWGQDQAWHNFLTGVATFSAGNLSPLFTTAVGSDPQNPALAFTLDSASANTVFANCTTGTANPSFCLLTAAMIPALPYVPSGTTFFYQTVDANTVAQTQRAALNFSSAFSVSDSASPSRTNVDLAATGVTANTYTCPSSLTINSAGQTTAAASGTCPTTHGVVANITFTTCGMSGGSTDKECSTSQSWGTTLPVGYSIVCNLIRPVYTAGDGISLTTFGLVGTPTTTSFTYYVANDHSIPDGTTVNMSCIAIT